MNFALTRSGLVSEVRTSAAPAAARPAGPGHILDIARVEDPAEIASEWRELHASQPSSPFQGTGWASAWCTHVADRPGHRPAIVTGRDSAGLLQMVLPLALRRYGPLRVASWIGTGHGSHITGLFSSELLARLDPASAEALRRDILAVLPGADCLALYDQPAMIGNRINPLVGGFSRPAVDNVQMLSLEAGGSEPLTATPNGRMRRNIRRRYRRLGELGKVRYDVPDGTGSRIALFDELCAQKTGSLERRGIRSFLNNPGYREFYRALLDARPADGAAGHICGMRLNGELIAASLGLIHDRVYHGLILSTTDDKKIRPCAPGHLLVDQLVTGLSAAGVAGFSLGAGLSEFKRRWCNREVELMDTLMPVTAAGHLAVRALATHRALKRRLKQSPRASAWFAIVRAQAGRARMRRSNRAVH